MPEGATFATVTLKTVEGADGEAAAAADAAAVEVDADDVASISDSSRRLVVLSTLQLLRGVSERHTTCDKYIRLPPRGGSYTASFRVWGSGTVELCVMQYWSSIGRTVVDVDVQFRGVAVEPSHIALSDATGAARVTVRAPLQQVSMSPSATLTKLRRAAKLKSAALVPLGARDVTSDGKHKYMLSLEYTFNVVRGARDGWGGDGRSAHAGVRRRCLCRRRRARRTRRTRRWRRCCRRCCTSTRCSRR